MYSEHFNDDFHYIDFDEVIEGNTLVFIYNVKGGYELDVNAYWGGREYVEQFIKSVKTHLIDKIYYELDESDLSGNILIEFTEEEEKQEY